MKKIIGIILCLTGLGGFAFAQAPTEEVTVSKNYFYANPFSIFESKVDLGYEYDLSNHNSFMISGNMTMMKTSSQNRQGAGGEIQYRINMLKHPDPKLKRGLQSFTFFAPYGRFDYLNVTDNNATAASYGSTTTGTVSPDSYIRSFAGGLLLGWRVSSSENRFAFTVFGGGGMKVSDVLGKKQYTDVFRSGYTGVVPRIGCQFGISF